MAADNHLTSIHEKNLSLAWAQVFVRCYRKTGNIIAPAIVTFDVDEDTEGWKLENEAIRHAVEEQLNSVGITSAGQSNIETVAGTIFPESIWKRCEGNRNLLFQRYDKMWPHIERCKNNRWGTYFRRLTAFHAVDGDKGTNQLEFIINAWHNGIRRHSALQASIFDPPIDHRPNPYLGFPCLQQIVLHHHGAHGVNGLSLIALYVNQLLLDKAYGNYLGLFRLGRFMANQMGITLRDVTCITTNLKLSEKAGTKTANTALVEKLLKEINNGDQ